MSLSSLIVQREVATMRQVEDALAHQVIYGGDLVTNLLEVAAVDEAVLTSLLAASMKLGPAPAGELPAPADVVRALVPGEMATEWSIVPLEAQGGRLVLAVAEPLSREQEAQLGLVLGMPIEQRAAPAVRVRQAIARAYGVPLERRLDKLVARLGGSASKPRSAPPQQRVTSTGFPRVSATPERAAAPSPPGNAPPPGGDGRVGLLQRQVSPSARPAHRRRGPVTAEAAKRAAEEATDRDELLDLFFDFSRQFFEYAALFLVHGDIAEGRDAFGVGAAPAKVLGIGVPLDMPSLLSRAREERAPVVAKIRGDGLDAVLLADLQRDRGVEIAVVPLVVRTRAVAFLVGDCGEPGVERTSIEQVAQFAGAVSRAFERIIVRRKLDGFIAGSRAVATGRVDPAMVREKRSATPTPARAASQPPAPERASWRPGPPVEPPPRANIASLRPISGPPIPREEPESLDSLPGAPAAARVQARPDVGEASADVHGLFDEHGWETEVEPEAEVEAEVEVEAEIEVEAEMEVEPEPASSAIVVPPRRPPVSYSQASGTLPSIIVDLELEFGELVDRVIAEQSEDAEAELLRQGERAMRVVMSRFPGPLTVQRARIGEMDRPPRPSECGPVLRLVVRERKVALPFVLERLEDDDPEVRGWATHLLCELPYAEAIPHLLRRLQDVDVMTRVSAAYALAAVARSFPGEVREAVIGLARSSDPFERGAAMHAMSELRQPALVPEMVHALGDGDERVVAAAHVALVLVTRQDFGADARPWLRWWEQNAGRHRVEWLIDALAHDVSEIRRGAAEELRAVSKEYFGYAGDLPPRERERAQQRYRDWWITEGRARFRRT